MVAITGVVCVTFSFSDPQAIPPSDTRNAARLWSVYVLRFAKMRSSSRHGDWQFSHPIVIAPYCATRSLLQMNDPLVAFMQTRCMWPDSAITLPSFTDGVVLGPSP